MQIKSEEISTEDFYFNRKKIFFKISHRILILLINYPIKPILWENFSKISLLVLLLILFQ